MEESSCLQVPELFKIFSNDLKKGVSSEVAKFANNMLFQVVTFEVDGEKLQKDSQN